MREIMESVVEGIIWGVLCIVMLLAAILSNVAYAEPLKVRMVYARGPNSLPRAQAKQLVDRALEEIRQETGVTATVRRFIVLDKNPFQSMHSDLSQAHLAWASWVLYFRDTSEASVNLAVVPPWKVNGIYWLLGYAHQCKEGGTAMVTMEPTNQDGLDRIAHSYTSLKHELMHVLGAKHRDNVCNIMHSAAMNCVPNTSTLRESVNEIKSCGGRW